VTDLNGLLDKAQRRGRGRPGAALGGGGEQFGVGGGRHPIAELRGGEGGGGGGEGQSDLGVALEDAARFTSPPSPTGSHSIQRSGVCWVGLSQKPPKGKQSNKKMILHSTKIALF
jgi:hypothetical protein